MRSLLIALPLLLVPAPAMAAPSESKPAQPQIPPELSDPAMADKLTRMMGPLTKVLMDLPIGELEAAAAGREPTPADRARHVRDEIGGPEEQRKLEAQVAASGPQMRAMQKALVASLPALMGALKGMEEELERATANLPDPTYPKR
jgi:hypothetical protein